MTVVAWDGKTLAADKAANSHGFNRTVTKVWRVPGGMVAFSGDGDYALQLLAWFREGRDPAKYPTFPTDNVPDALFVDLGGHAWTYGKVPHPQKIESRYDAMGHGRDYALAAMYLGCDARRAVEVTNALDCFCGNGVDSITLEELNDSAANQDPDPQLPAKAAVL